MQRFFIVLYSTPSLLLILLLLLRLRGQQRTLASCYAPSFYRRRDGRAIGRRLVATAAAAAKDNDDNDIDDLRRLLETAWNAETMGRVPTSANGAAEASAAALATALERKESSLFFVDILLPQYDISAGTNLYDEVLAVEFCIALAKLLPCLGQTEILVRDSKVLNTVNRILDAREGVPSASRTLRTETSKSDDSADVGAFDGIDEGVITKDTKGELSPSKLGPQDTNDIEDSVEPPTESSEVESFRKLLLLSWETSVDMDVVREEERLGNDVEPTQQQNTTPELDRGLAERSYRLSSLLGDAVISKGSDMVDNVMAAVSANALPRDGEDTIIILSACTKEELFAVRAMAEKYDRSKTIILVNCKLDPIPRELMRAQTIYSILPLIARPTRSDDKATAPKVVVLRRYPRDWEVYVDTGQGFDLAASVPPSSGNRRGPSMEWISSAVKRYLQNI